MTRLVAVLGYSDGNGNPGLHPVCASRLLRAATETSAEDVVLFSGWARTGFADAEADLMAASWSHPVRARIVDRGARTTLGNALAVARTARRIGAEEVVLVTSRWHARRATTLVRAALVGSSARLRVAAAEEPVSTRHVLREAGAWLLVPALVVVAARNR